MLQIVILVIKPSQIRYLELKELPSAEELFKPRRFRCRRRRRSCLRCPPRTLRWSRPLCRQAGCSWSGEC